MAARSRRRTGLTARVRERRVWCRLAALGRAPRSADVAGIHIVAPAAVGELR
jgi:hypothetical protein